MLVGRLHDVASGVLLRHVVNRQCGDIVSVLDGVLPATGQGTEILQPANKYKYISTCTCTILLYLKVNSCS